MRFITNANLISTDTGFGFARNTVAGMGDVRHGAKDRDALHLRLYAKRFHKRSCSASSAASIGSVAAVGERTPVVVCGLPPAGSCFEQLIARTRQPGWSLQRGVLAGPQVSPAFGGIS